MAAAAPAGPAPTTTTSVATIRWVPTGRSAALARAGPVGGLERVVLGAAVGERAGAGGGDHPAGARPRLADARLLRGGVRGRVHRHGQAGVGVGRPDHHAV